MKTDYYKILYFSFLFFTLCSNSQVQKVTIKNFLDSNISQKKYTIELFNNELKNSDYYFELLNKTYNNKMFYDAQEYATNLYSTNCIFYKSQINYTADRIKDIYYEGKLNTDYLIKNHIKYNEIEYQKSFESVKKYTSYLDYSDDNCYTYLNELTNRTKGIFNSQELAKNVISFNYLLNPSEEISKNHIQTFTTIESNLDEDFYITLQLPLSWDKKDKKDLTKASTLCLFSPHNNFLNANIVASLISMEEMKSVKISNKEAVETIYNDDELLNKFFNFFVHRSSNSKVKCTLFNSGTNTFILYSLQADGGDLIKNTMLDGKIAKSLGAITIHNGRILSIIGGAINEVSFDSFNYYSKIFFKVITSLKIKEIKKNTIYLVEQENMKLLNVNINGVSHKFTLDTGADSVVINKKILSELLESNFLTRDNFINKTKSIIADGTIIDTEDWLIPKMKVGNYTIENITVSVVDSEDGSLLFGMNGLKKLNISELNLIDNEIIIKK